MMTADRQFKVFVQCLASIITDRIDNIPKDQSNYYLREETKKSVKKRQQKVKQTNYRPFFKDTIKAEDKKYPVKLKPYIL